MNNKIAKMEISEEEMFNTSQSAQLLEASQQLFENIVTRDFLHKLSDCKVIPLPADYKNSHVGWYKLTKIVKEKDVYFTDKLSMLFMALHRTAKNVAVVIQKESNELINFYIGARDFSKEEHISSSILDAGLDGYFPGIEKSYADNIEQLNIKSPNLTCVSALASLRDEKKENFVQGIEKLINATYCIPRFTAYFIADNVSPQETSSIIHAYNDLYSQLSPAQSLQMTYSESDTKGISDTITKNFSTTIGKSISQTITHTEGYNENNTETEGTSGGTNSNVNILKSIWHSIVGGKIGSNEGWNKSTARSIGKNFSDATADQTGTSTSEQKGDANSHTTNDSLTKGRTQQVTFTNRQAKYYLEILDNQLNRLQNGAPFGLWSVATYFMANDPETSQQLANIYRGCIIGEESGLETCAINSWSEKQQVLEIYKYLTNTMQPRFMCDYINVSAGSVVTSKELSIHLSFPQSSVPGVVVEERASFGRNIYDNGKIKHISTDAINLGKIVHLGKVYEDSSVPLSIQELTKHTFITGSTGSGKSNTVYHILSQLKNIKINESKNKIKFMVIEPAKGEYKNVFGSDEDVKIYSNSIKMGELLRINPFSFPDEIHVLEHIDRLVEIFNACWPMYAAMPAVLKKSIIDAYKNCGWDLINSTNKFMIYPTIEDVLISLKEYINKSEYSADTKGDYKGAIETRLQSLTEGIIGQMVCGNEIPASELFDQNIIVDLHRISSVETKSLLMGFLIMKLNEYRMSQGGMDMPLKHVTVIEEAHHLLKKTSFEQSQESSNLAGKAVEMISNSIAEMRTYGEAFIIVDQAPSLLDSAAIRNTNTKIVMALPEAEDRRSAGLSLALNEHQIEAIAKQKQGEAIVYQNTWEEAVQCKIDKADVNIVAYQKSGCLFEYEQPKAKEEIINYLLHPYTKKSFNIDNVETLVKKITLGSLKYGLLQSIQEYRTDIVPVEIWQHDKYPKLRNIICQYLNTNEGVNVILKYANDGDTIKRKVETMLYGILPDADLLTIKFLERCLITNVICKKPSLRQKYELWYESFKINKI